MRHRVVRVLPYSPEQLFQLVGDVERYPDFVPWVTSLSVRNPRTEGEGISILDAEAGVGFSFVKEKFATRVRRDAKTNDIIVTLLWGPFRRLLNHWRFEPSAGGCQVVFEIDFEFKSRLLDMMLAANFARAVDKLIGCFEARAQALYPSGGPPPLEGEELPGSSPLGGSTGRRPG